jgi:hypothetical protein
VKTIMKIGATTEDGRTEKKGKEKKKGKNPHIRSMHRLADQQATQRIANVSNHTIWQRGAPWLGLAGASKKWAGETSAWGGKSTKDCRNAGPERGDDRLTKATTKSRTAAQTLSALSFLSSLVGDECKSSPRSRYCPPALGPVPPLPSPPPRAPVGSMGEAEPSWPGGTYGPGCPGEPLEAVAEDDRYDEPGGEDPETGRSS